jgi:hypothetical protein
MTLLILRFLVGLLLVSIPAWVAWRIHYFYRIPYALLLVGIMTFTGAFITQQGFLWLIDGPLLVSPLIAALLTGLAIGLTDTLARFLGFQYLARSSVYRPQAAMIGLGHALLPMLYTGLWAIWLFLGLAKQPLTPIELERVGADAIAEFAITLAPLAMHMALSWMVLQTFLRNEIKWLLVALVFQSTMIGTAEFIARASTEPLVVSGIWWVVAASLSIVLFRRIDPPPEFIRERRQPEPPLAAEQPFRDQP